jgi:hypothetical protein
MIYELRVYQPLPGKMAKMQNRFSGQLLSIWDRHGIRPVGFWTTLLGESSNELTYILAWESLADRERKWTAFQQDPAWHKAVLPLRDRRDQLETENADAPPGLSPRDHFSQKLPQEVRAPLGRASERPTAERKFLFFGAQMPPRSLTPGECWRVQA